MSQTTTNQTITTLLNRRSIRQFSTDPLDDDTIATLEAVAQRAPSSQFLNDWSAIRITDPSLKTEIASIGRQSYIAQAPLLYIFVADQHRNAVIAQSQGVDTHSGTFTLNAGYRYAQAQNDTVLALHAVETAANSLGLGSVILGSVLNDSNRLIDLLHLPQYTVPVLGLAIGKPVQSPELKPRMPRSMQFFENTYPSSDTMFLEPLQQFDEAVHQYYDLRHADRPVAAFSTQVKAVATAPEPRAKAIAPIASRQGFDLDH